MSEQSLVETRRRGPIRDSGSLPIERFINVTLNCAQGLVVRLPPGYEQAGTIMQIAVELDNRPARQHACD